MTVIEQLQSAETYAGILKAQIIRLGGTPAPDDYPKAISKFSRQAAPAPVTPSATAPKAPVAPAPAPKTETILDKYNAMKPGRDKDAFLQANHKQLFALSKAQAAAAKPATPTK